MRTQEQDLFQEFAARFSAPPPSQRVSDWVEKNIVFNEPEIRGSFDFVGREYLRQPLDDNNDPSVFKQTLVFGTGNGKTITYMAGMGWKIVHKQPRSLWVMPSEHGANGVRNFNNSRLIPMCKATAAIAEKMPAGAQRHKVSGIRIHMNGTVIDFAGANSPGQLTGNRCSDVRLDEVDKFKSQLGAEAGAAYLAETRTDGVIGAQIFLSSSPAAETGPIWTSLLTSNLQRRFIPCPHCGRNHPVSKKFTIIWNEQYCTLPNKFFDGTEIPSAKIRWDKEAKRKDGTWDIDRVVRSARAECPHCGNHVKDSDMAWCDSGGEWIPTRNVGTASKHSGYHLPTMFAPRRGFESTFGGMAKKFLDSAASADGMRGFINSVLAEPDIAQENDHRSIEIVSPDKKENESKWVPILTGDVQQKWPYFWFIIRRWLEWVILPPHDDASLFKIKSETPPELSAKLPIKIIAELMRFDKWEKLSAWMISNGITGRRSESYFLEEYEGDTLRAIESLCKLAKINIGKQGDSEAVEIGHCDDWRDLDELQLRHKIENENIIIDSGWGATDNADVYAECFLRANQYCYYDTFSKKSTIHKAPNSLPLAINGWLPSKGFPKDKRWRDSNGIVQPYEMRIDDPMKGKSEAGQAFHWVFNFSKIFFLEELKRLRERKINLWGISESCEFVGDQMTSVEDYQRHMSGKWKDKDGEWQERKLDHLYDCENIQIAYATFKGIFDYQKKSGDQLSRMGIKSK